MKLDEERLKAYAAMSTVTKTIKATAPYDNTDPAEAHALIELVTDNNTIINIAGKLLEAMDSARGILWQLEQDGVENPFETTQLKTAKERVERERAQFMQLAKDELKDKPERRS
jgi:hypothetical protein